MTKRERQQLSRAIEDVWTGPNVDRGWTTLFRLRDGRNKQKQPMNNRPAIITLARLFVTCPVCKHDLKSPSGKPDWTMEEVFAIENVEERDKCPMCPSCGEFLTVVLPEAVEVVAEGES